MLLLRAEEREAPPAPAQPQAEQGRPEAVQEPLEEAQPAAERPMEQQPAERLVEQQLVAAPVERRAGQLAEQQAAAAAPLK